MQTQNYKTDFTGKNIFVGIDSHLKSWTVSIMLDDLMLKRFSQNPSPELLAEYLHHNYPGATYYSAYEASYCGFWIHKKLTSLGISNIVVNPADVPTTDKERKQKEDRRDSRKIARSLQKKELEGIYIPSDENIEDRALMRLREKITVDLTRDKNRTKSALYLRGIEIPEEFCKSGHWSKRFIKWIEELKFINNSGNHVRDTLLHQIKNHRESLLILTRQIKELSTTEMYKANFEVLKSVPGVGLITAMVLLTELDQISRFVNFDHLCSYVGISPSTDSTGDKEKVKGLTPRHNNLLRKTIIESTWTAIRIDPALSLAYSNYRQKMNEQKAIVKVAKKLLSRIYFVLRTKAKYVPCVVK